MYKIAAVTKDGGVDVSETQKLETNWEVADTVAGYE